MILYPHDDLAPDAPLWLFWFCQNDASGLHMGVLALDPRDKDVQLAFSSTPARLRHPFGGSETPHLHAAMAALSLAMNDDKPWGALCPLAFSTDGDIWISCRYDVMARSASPFRLSAQELARCVKTKQAADHVTLAVRQDAAAMQESWAQLPRPQKWQDALRKNLQSLLLRK